MNRTLMAGVALVLLTPTLALAQARGGRGGRGGGEGRLPPGVRRVENPDRADVKVTPQMIQRLVGALKSLEQRVDRLEKGYKGLVTRLKAAHEARPDARRRAMATRDRRGARSHDARRRPNAHGDWRRMMQNPRFRALAGRMRGRLHEAYPVLKRALAARQRAHQARRSHRGGLGDHSRGRSWHRGQRRGHGPQARMAHPGAKRPERMHRTDRRADAGKLARLKAAKAAQAKAKARKLAMAKAKKEKVAKARRTAPKKARHPKARTDVRKKRPAPAPDGLMAKARALAKENAKLKAEIRKLQAQMKRLIEAVQKRRKVDRRS